MAESKPTHHHHHHRGEADGETGEGQRRPKRQLPKYPLPPNSFIPLKASEEERRAFGFPPRPDPATQPTLYRLWERTLSFPMQIQHEPAVAAHVRLPDNAGTVALKDLVGPLPSGPSAPSWNDAASVYQSLAGCTNVSASWNVPRIGVPVGAPGLGPWAVSCVVQLDSLLLGGTTSLIGWVNSARTSTYTHTFAWAQFLSNGVATSTDKVLKNFSVSPGDYVTCSVCAPFSQAYGTFIINNQTTGVPTQVLVEQPDDSDLLPRVSGAWGVVPESGNTDTVFNQRATFPTITFVDCSCTRPGASLGLEPGEVVSNLAALAGTTEPNPVWEVVLQTAASFLVVNEQG